MIIVNKQSLLNGFLVKSVGKESTCHAGDTCLIPGLGRSAGEEIGDALQHSWASLVAQLVKNPPTMQKTWIQSLGWEDPLEKGKATRSSILAYSIPWTVQSMRSQRVRQDRDTFTFTANDVKHLFVRTFAICINLVDCLFISSAYFLTGVFVFLPQSFESSLYIPNMSLSLNIQLVNIS